MAKSEEVRRERSRQPELAERRRREARRRASLIAVVVGFALAVGAVFVFVGGGDQDNEGDPGVPAGVRTFSELARNHVEDRVDYDPIPPVGGDHAPVWQNCGFYPAPIVAEMGVHSLEHGAVWVTFRPDLAQDQVSSLRQLAQGQTFVLVSPWEDGLPAPVVASTWGRQLALPSASDRRLEQFIRAFRQGPQSPEPGAPCTGGRGARG